jgi:hypothetical protein
MRRIALCLLFLLIAGCLCADNALDLFDKEKEVYIFVDCPGPWRLHCTMWELDGGFKVTLPVKEAVFTGNKNRKISLEEAAVKPSDEEKGYLLLCVLESRASTKNLSIHIVEGGKTSVFACPNIDDCDIVQLQYMLYSNPWSGI